MVWTSPRTWVDLEIPTASLFNLHIRDNMLVLKTPFANDGKVRALDNTVLASLDGTALQGLAMLAAANAHTAGNNDFNGGASVRLRLPVGVDKFDGTAHGDHVNGAHTNVVGNKTPGSAWVEADGMHYVDDGKVEMRYTGSLVHTDAAALAGSVWIEGNEYHYIDELGGDERVVPSVATGLHADAAARSGGIWIDTNDRIHIINSGTQEYDLHTDVPAHSDGHSNAHGNTHTNTHGDHGDSHANTHSNHSDTAHGNTHTNHNDHADSLVPENPGHADSHTNHGDTAHDDTHSNVHSNAHGDHGDTHSNTHGNTHSNHSDVHGNQPETIGL